MNSAHSPADRFEILPWKLGKKANVLHFHFKCPVYGKFEETIELPSAIPEAIAKTKPFNDLAWLLACALAVSYFKLWPSPVIYVGAALSSDEQSLVTSIFTQGLGEFYARNELPYPPQLKLECGEEDSAAKPESFEGEPPSGDPIVAFGGGKDSHVSMQILKRLGFAVNPVSVVLSPKTEDKLRSMHSGDLTIIKRALDPKLFELNARPETLNGHVPITAINSLILSLYGLCIGSPWVIFSNEKGSSQFTRLYHGAKINHQYSKGIEFEKMLGTSIASASGGRVTYFSMLRAFSEMWIGKFFGKHCKDEWLNMASCNRNFIFHKNDGLALGKRWCGACSKCVYTALVIAPFVSEADFLSLFETDLLDFSSNVDTARSLAGLSGEKPWECVGDITDTRAVMHVLAYAPVWRDKAVFKAIGPEIDALQTIESSRAHMAQELAATGPHFAPEELFAKIVALTADP